MMWVILVHTCLLANEVSGEDEQKKMNNKNKNGISTYKDQEPLDQVCFDSLLQIMGCSEKRRNRTFSIKPSAMGLMPLIHFSLLGKDK